MKKIGVILFAVIFLLGITTPVKAQTTSRWSTKNPEKLTTSDGIEITYESERVDKWGQSGSGDIKGIVNINIVIPSDYRQKDIVVAPEVFKEIASMFEKDNMTINNNFHAGDTVEINYKITNNSKYTYYYNQKTFAIFTDDTFNLSNGTTTTFNGKTISKNEYFRRVYNTALAALIPNSKGTKMTDDAVSIALIEKGYNGINDIAKYYLDFYNQKYGTNHARLDEFNDGIIREMFSDRNTDPIQLAENSVPSIPNKTLKQLPGKNRDEKLTNAGYNNIHEFIQAEYSKTCGYTITSYDNLCEVAEKDFFSYAGMERDTTDFVTETNEELLTLAYDYFYNKLLSYDLNHEVKNLTTGNNTEHYSIGEYMRNPGKGDNIITEKFGEILPNNTYELNETLIKLDGNYTRNIYLDYQFKFNIQMSFSAKKGTVISKYIDGDTNEEIAPRETTEGLVNDDYQTSKKDIDGYTYIKVEGAPEGKYIDGVIYVTYIYTKVATGDVEVTPPKTGVNQPSIPKEKTKIASINYNKKEEEEFI